MKNAECKFIMHNAEFEIAPLFRSANIHLPLWGRGTAAFAVVDEVFPFPFPLGTPEAPVGRGKRLKAHGPAAAPYSRRVINRSLTDAKRENRGKAAIRARLMRAVYLADDASSPFDSES